MENKKQKTEKTKKIIIELTSDLTVRINYHDFTTIETIGILQIALTKLIDKRLG